MTLTANGVDLSTLAYNVESLTGRLSTPPRRGNDVDVPGRHGTIRSPGKKYTAGTVVLPMWVVGSDDGWFPVGVDNQELLYKNIDTLTRVFGSDTIELIHTLPDNSTRRIVGQVLETIDFTSQAGGTRATFAVTLSTADPFWEDVLDTTAIKSGTGTWNVFEFFGATAPMDDLVIKFTGPCTNPRITNSSGVYVQYNAVLTGSQTISIDCSNWTLSGVGITPSYSSLVHIGDARWFILEPKDPEPVVTTSQTAGSTGVFTLIGRRKYLVG